MATKKPEAAPVSVPAPETTTAVVPWRDRMMALTKQVADAEKGTSNYISFRNSAMWLGEQRFKDDMTEVVIVDYVFENRHYAERYVAGKITSPVCYAFGRTEDELAPHEKAERPQAASCAECPKGEWVPQEGGGAKRECSWTRRLHLIAAADLDNIVKADIYTAVLPPTSATNFRKFVNQIAQSMGMPPFGVVCEMSVKPHPKYLFQVHFKPIRAIQDEEVLAKLMGKHDQAKKMPLEYMLNEERQQSGKF